MIFFFFKQKTAYEIYQCDWSSDVCSSDLDLARIYLRNHLGSDFRHVAKNLLRHARKTSEASIRARTNEYRASLSVSAYNSGIRIR